MVPVGYAIVHLWQQANASRPPRGSWPQAHITRAMNQIWQDETGKPLRYVAGHFWPAGLVALSGRTMPTVLVDGDLASAPGTTLSDVRKGGLLIVNTPNHATTPDTFPGLAAAKKIGTLTLPFPYGRRGQTISLRYAIIAPDPN